MTRIEKQTIIAALAAYRNQNMQKANTARKNLEHEKAAECSAEANKAHALITTFLGILDKEPGTVTI